MVELVFLSLGLCEAESLCVTCVTVESAPLGILARMWRALAV